MSTKSSKSKSSTKHTTSHHNPKESKPMHPKSPKPSVHHESPNEERSTMSAHSTKIESAVVPVPVAASAHVTSVPAAASAPEPQATPPAGAAPTAAASPTAPAATGAPSQPSGPVAPPPANAKIPIPPEGYTPSVPGEFRTVVPRQRELTALPLAIQDLQRFSEYDTALGSTAPTRADVLEAFTAGYQWTSMYTATINWEKYAMLMQGLAWQVIRTQLASLRVAFLLAVKRNPSLGEKYTNLAKLLAVPATVAQQATATKKANKKADANGELPTHGKVGKKALKAAQKAALAEKQAAAKVAAPVASTPASSPVQSPAPSPAPSVAASPAAPATVNGAGSSH